MSFNVTLYDAEIKCFYGRTVQTPWEPLKFGDGFVYTEPDEGAFRKVYLKAKQSKATFAIMEVVFRRDVPGVDETQKVSDTLKDTNLKTRSQALAIVEDP